MQWCEFGKILVAVLVLVTSFVWYFLVSVHNNAVKNARAMEDRQMKIRQGFVSNSSSSSFVVGFYRKPKDVAELQQLLFQEDQIYPHPYDDEGIPVEKVASREKL